MMFSFHFGFSTGVEDLRRGSSFLGKGQQPVLLEPRRDLVRRSSKRRGMWLGGKGSTQVEPETPLPLVLFDHPCLFRQAALHALEAKNVAWRLSLTTPSLPGIWATLRSTAGITVRTAHRLPQGIRDVGIELGLPRLPKIELRMIFGSDLSPAASQFRDILDEVIRGYIEPELKKRSPDTRKALPAGRR
jgi:DNA-binding transcriptional LysR family regulator